MATTFDGKLFLQQNPTPSSVSSSQTTGQCSLFICEVCGFIIESIDNFKLHLKQHNFNQQNQLDANNNNIKPIANTSTATSTLPPPPPPPPPPPTTTKPSSSSSNNTIANILPTTSTRQSSSNTIANILNSQNNIIKQQQQQPQQPILFENNRQQSQQQQQQQKIEDKTQIVTLDDNNVEIEIEVVQTTKDLILNDNSIKNKGDSLSHMSTPPSTSVMTTGNTLPFRFLEDSNIYICNLCECSYESLRSMKAHLWKHSGHHNLSYPINDNSLSSSVKTEPNSETTPQHESEQENSSTESNRTISSENNRSSSSSGICSVLLEVIEKLHYQEEDLTHTVLKSNFKNIKVKKNMKNQKYELKNIVDKKLTKKKRNSTPADSSSVPKIPSKRGRKRKILVNSEDMQIESNDQHKQQLSCHSSSNTSINTLDADESTTNSTDLPQTTAPLCYKCDYCDFKSTGTNKQFLIDHINEEHSRQVLATAPIAKRKYTIKNRHKKVTSSQITSTEPTIAPLVNNSTTIPQDKGKLLSLMVSLATNDGCEQYVCGLCSYVCYHLPSLKSHMWLHVTSRNFDYSLNTAIINAALDYENRLNRNLAQLKLKFDSIDQCDDSQLAAVDFSSYPLSNKISSLLTKVSSDNIKEKESDASSISPPTPIVSFRCSKCGYSTIDLSLLRAHKRQH